MIHLPHGSSRVAPYSCWCWFNSDDWWLKGMTRQCWMVKDPLVFNNLGFCWRIYYWVVLTSSSPNRQQFEQQSWLQHVAPGRMSFKIRSASFRAMLIDYKGWMDIRWNRGIPPEESQEGHVHQLLEVTVFPYFHTCYSDNVYYVYIHIYIYIYVYT